MLDIFTFTDSTLLVNRKDIMLIEEFKYLFNGKDANLAELKYIYWYADYRSFYIGYSDRERHEKACQEVKFPIDYKQSPKLKKAIEKYIELQTAVSPSIKINNGLKRNLYLLGETITTTVAYCGKKIQDINKKLEELDKNNKEILNSLDDLGIESAEKKELENKENKLFSDLDRMNSKLLELMPLGEKIEKSMQSIKILEEKVKQDVSNAKTRIGNKEIGNRAY